MPPHSTQLLISIHVNTPWKSNSNKTWLDLETYLHELGKSSQWIRAYLVRIFVKVTLTLCSNVFSKGWLKTLPLIYSEFWWEASQTLGCLTGWHSQVVKIKPPKQTLLNVEFMRQLLTIKKKMYLFRNPRCFFDILTLLNGYTRRQNNNNNVSKANVTLSFNHKVKWHQWTS